MTDLEVLQELSASFLRKINAGKAAREDIRRNPEKYRLADYISAEERWKGVADCNQILLELAEKLGYNEEQVWRKR